jgi:hypothetical protein
MQQHHVVEALDWSLQDITGKQQPFGGITMLFGGDFRQTLPVIPKGSRETIVGATFCRSSLWQHIQVLKLEKNEWLDQTPESELFASWLLEVGSGHGLSADNSITLPAHMHCGDTPDSLISSIYLSGDAQLTPLLDAHKHEVFARRHYQIRQSWPITTSRDQCLVCWVTSLSIPGDILTLVFISRDCC